MKSTEKMMMERKVGRVLEYDQSGCKSGGFLQKMGIAYNTTGQMNEGEDDGVYRVCQL